MYGLPAGGMKAIRTRGERSNADQVSPVGARTVYQIMPKTRGAFQKRYKVDAYADIDSAAHVAALHLRDDLKRTGSWEGAVRGYIGGPDPRQHGKVTRAYVSRVTGNRVTARADVPASPGVHTDGKALQAGEVNWLGTSTGDYAWAERPLGPEAPNPKDTPSGKRLSGLLAVVGAGGIPGKVDTPNTPVIATELAEQQQGEATEARRIELGKAGFFGRAQAATDENWLLAEVGRSMDRAQPEAEEGYTPWYMANREDIEAFAQTPHERTQLRQTTSKAGLAQVKLDIGRERQNWEIADATGHGTAFSLIAGLADPAGWVAGYGVGKAFQVAGIGSRVLAQSGRVAGAVASAGAEGMIGNVGFTALLDAAGRTTTSEDYAMSAGLGLGIGLGLSPLTLRGRAEPQLPASAERVVQAAQEAQGARLAQASRVLGEGATPEQIATEAKRLDARDQRNFVLSALGDIPDTERLLHSDPEKLLTRDPAVKQGVTDRYNLSAAVADDAERDLLAEHLARAEAIVAANPVDEKALNTILRAGGWESTGLRLLRSESPVAKAVGTVLLESTTGAAGRRPTAALAMATRQRMYLRTFYGFDGLYHQFRRSEGAGLVSEAVTGKVRRRFDERVFDEVEARSGSPEGQYFDANPFVREAADLWERGMNQMRTEMQHVDTVGAARLGNTSRGYMTHKLDARKVVALTGAQRTQVRDILSAQFIDPDNGFSPEFSKKLATKYLERAEDAAKGGYDVPMNLRSPEAAQIVRDALEAMSIPSEELDKLMGKFSRGGANFTKQRLRLNLQADIGDGMVLRDLFTTDLASMYRSYARRVAGEVALAQYGVMGKKGLNELRKAISASGGSVDDMKAYDQIAAEFLNTPFGEHNHRFMDNLRVATGAARLGGMGFTQFAEYGNGLAALGVQRVFAAIGALPRLVREVGHLKAGGTSKNPILGSLDLLGGDIGMDEYQLTRFFDVKDSDIQVYSSENIGLGSRALRGAAHAQAVLTGQRLITAVQTRGMAEQIARKAMKFIRSGNEDEALADMGFTPELAEAIRGDLPNVARFDGDRLVELGLTKSKLPGYQLAQLRDAVERGASQIIQRTYVGETGKWAHDGFLKMLAQFRTFGVTAVEKQWGRGVRNHGAIKSAMYLLGSMSFAVPVHIARVQAKMTGMSRSEREKYADQNLSVGALGRASLNYASASGLLGDIIDVGGGFASSFGGDGGEELAKQIGVRGTKGQSQLIGGVIAPGVGLVEDVWDGVHGDGKKLVKIMPGANLPYAQPIINAVSAD
jgi:hypothetical protein